MTINENKKTIFNNFMPVLKPESANKKGTFLCADFETVIHNGQHFVFCSSIYTENDKPFVGPGYIDLEKLNSNLSNLKECSDVVLLQFWSKLNMYIKSCNVKSKHLVYFHNMNRFDGMFILRLITLLMDNYGLTDNDISVIQRKGVFYEIKIKNICIRDSIQILPGKLENLGQTFLGTGKLEIVHGFNYRRITREKKEIIKYCNADSKLLYDVLYKFQNKIINIFNIDLTKTLTISSIAFKLFRTQYLKEESIQNTTIKQNLTMFIRSSFRGGLSTVINPYSFNNDITGIDINSSYSNTMCQELPIGLGEWADKNYLKKLNENLLNIDKIFGFVDVTILLKENYIVSPLIIHYQGKLTDVTGEIRIVIFSEELKFIIKNNGKLIKIHRFIEYSRGFPMKQFAIDLFERKNESKRNGDKINEFIYKLIMNSCYGRFGLQETSIKNTIVANENIPIIEKYGVVFDKIDITEKFSLITTQANKLNETEKKNLKLEEKKISNLIRDINISTLRGVQIASAISSLARIQLLEKIMEITSLGGKVYYTDTDSVYFSGLPIEKIKGIGKNLGEWDIIDKNLSAIFIQPKLYITKNKEDKITTKIKGLPYGAFDKKNNTTSLMIKDPTTNLTNKINVWDIFKNRLLNSPIEVKYDKTFIRNIKDNTVYAKNNQSFKIKLESNPKRKHIFDSDGLWVTTKPFNISYNAAINNITEKLNINKNNEIFEAINKNININDFENELIKYLSKFSENINTERLQIPFLTYVSALKYLKTVPIKFENNLIRVIITYKEDEGNEISYSSEINNISNTITLLHSNAEKYKDSNLVELKIVLSNDSQKIFTEIILSTYIYFHSIITTSTLDILSILRLYKAFNNSIYEINDKNILIIIYKISNEYNKEILNEAEKFFKEPKIVKYVIDQMIN